MRHRLTIALIFAAFFAATPGAQAADVIVISSTVASLKTGQVVGSETEIDLPAGGAVTFFNGAAPVDVTGPFSGTVALAIGAPAAANSVVGDLMSRRKRVRGLAASRSIGGGKRADTALHLMADRVWCVDGPAPELYLRPAKKDRVVILIDGGASHEMLWPAGVSTQPWPDAVAFKAGSELRMQVGEVIAPFPLQLVAGPGGEGGARLGGLLTAGCAAQADALAGELSGAATQ